MRRLNKPDFEFSDVFDECVKGIEDFSLFARFTEARQDVIRCFEEYVTQGSLHQLFMLQASLWGNNDQQILANLTKKEFIDLYSDQMVSKKKSARNYYDRLKLLAPLGKCPFCGFGHVSTLDHFLSKAYYPVFSVLSANLIPACADCNKGKGASKVTLNSQMLHPYFEEEIIDSGSWLYAEVIESVPCRVRYFVKPSQSWPDDLRMRISNHFQDLELARRFSVEAASELAGIVTELDYFKNPDSISKHLVRRAKAERSHFRNSWKAALYEALADSAWFHNGGYKAFLYKG